MAETDLRIQLLRTKFHRPKVTTDHIPRSSLLARLNRHRQRPLTLISAPAGYGKSTLASSWLASVDIPGAWVSLDENDNNPRSFLAYFLGAVQPLFPGSLSETNVLLSAPALPPVPVLAQSLINELDALESAFILVLDDYHTIQVNEVHRLLSRLLKYPPAPLHLVLATRYEPPLSIASFRAHHMMTEIRARDLRFSRQETSAYLKRTLGVAATESAAIELEKKTEGWITGIHLAVLALRRRGQVDQCVSNLADADPAAAIDRCVSRLPENTHYIIDYFITEIFSNLPAHLKEMLLRTAILKQFNAELCEALLADGAKDGSPAIVSGREFIDWLRQSNLFIIAQDNEGRWFRYHHLFQQLLVRLLHSEWHKDAIASLHQSASGWFERHARIGEAIDHALAAEDVPLALEVLERHRHTALNSDNWQLLENWVARFPEACHQNQPAVLITKAWVSNSRGAFWAIPAILERLDLIGRDEASTLPLENEIEFFKGVVLFWDGRIADSREHLERALKTVGEHHSGAKNEMDMYFATTGQMLGHGQAMIQAYQQKVYHMTQDGPRKARLIGCLIFVHLLSGDLAEAMRWSTTFLEIGTMTQNHFVIAWGEYLLGYIYYQKNALKAAVDHFSRATEGLYFLDSIAPVDTFAGLALACQALQQLDKAQQTMDALRQFARQSHSAEYMDLADAARAELLMARDDPLSAAEQFKSQHIPVNASPMLFGILEPRITHCKVMLAHAAAANRHEFTDCLNQHLQVAQTTHNIPQTIALLNLKALAGQRINATGQALTLLEQALKLGQPGGWVRPFVMPGREMRGLYDRLDRKTISQAYVDTIIAAIDHQMPARAVRAPAEQTSSRPANAGIAPVAPLTHREIDILDLLRGRLSNQEIADKLCISPETVKRHLYNIYKKLSVKNRREAAAKIVALQRPT